MDNYNREELKQWRDDFAPLLIWYKENKRVLPWRLTKNPYHIWVSEIMLQQTRVEAVKPYYDRFIQALPRIEDLAKAPEDQILKLWEGLGYYNRVRNMQKAAIQMVDLYHGEFPQSYEEIELLQGIGSYTAGAIASIAFGIPKPAVDGNVLRVLARVFDDDSDILKQSTKRKMERLVQELIPEDEPGDFNQALIELGALLCLPNGVPKCDDCPLMEHCQARKNQRLDIIPVRKKQKARRIENRTILVFKDGENIAIAKRKSKGLLAGLYEFPNQNAWLSQEEVVELSKSIGLMPIYVKELPRAKHVFSHIEWHMIGYEIKVDELEKTNAKEFLFIHPDEIRKEYPIPSAFEVYTNIVFRG